MDRIKRVLIGILTITLLAGVGAGEVFAEAPNGRVSGDIPEPSEPMATIDNGEVTPEEAATSEEAAPEASEEAETAEETAEETEVTTEESSGETNIDEKTFDEMWPVYISLGGIALTILLILIINIAHRKSRK